MEYEFNINSLDELQNIAKLFAKNLEKTDIIALNGSLGTGKTSFSRFLIQAIANDDLTVSSPTFNILNIYNLDDIDIYHYDLYRIENENDIYELAIDDAMTYGITIIEWPDIMKNQLPEKTIYFNINIANEDNDNERHVSISSLKRNLDFLDN